MFEEHADSDAKHCSQCGDPLHNIPKTDDTTVNYYHEFEDFCEKNGFKDTFENLTETITNVLIPNLDFLERETDIEELDEEVVNIEDVDPKKEIKQMEDRFHTAIERIQKFYGVENVKLGWGVVAWAS